MRRHAQLDEDCSVEALETARQVWPEKHESKWHKHSIISSFRLSDLRFLELVLFFEEPFVNFQLSQEFSTDQTWCSGSMLPEGVQNCQQVPLPSF
jgi:hypothetical protein